MKRILFFSLLIGSFGFAISLYSHKNFGGADQNREDLSKARETALVDKSRTSDEKQKCKMYSPEDNVIDIEDLVKRLKFAFSSRKELADFILYHSGIDVRKGRKLFNLMAISEFNAPQYYEGDAIRVNPLSEKAILASIHDGDIENITSKIYNNELSSENYFEHQGKYVFLIELILLLNHPDRESIIRSVLSTGFEPKVSDIISSIKEGITTELMNEIFIASNVKANTRLKSDFHHRSFSTYAIYENQYDFFKYWVEKGSPAEPDKYVVNSLDILSFRNDEFNQAEIDNIYVTLINKGIRPNNRSSLANLERIVSEAVYQDNPIANEIDTNIKQMMDLELQFYEDFINSFNPDILTDFSNPSCTILYGRDLIRFLFKQLTKKPKPKHLPRNPSSDDFDLKIEETKSLFTNEEDILSHLGGNQTLYNKNLIEYYLKQKAINALDIAVSDASNASPDENVIELQSKLEDVYKLAREGRWREAQTLVLTLGIEKRQAISTLLVYAVNLKADINVVRSLFNNGAYFEPAILYTVIYSGNTQLAEVFYENGLDIKYVSPLHENAVVMATKLQQYEMLNWLISKGATVNSQSYGYDALDVALLSNMPTKMKMDFISVLINNGAIVETSHRQAVKQIFKNDVNQYFKIVSSFPSLSEQ